MKPIHKEYVQFYYPHILYLTLFYIFMDYLSSINILNSLYHFLLNHVELLY